MSTRFRQWVLELHIERLNKTLRDRNKRQSRVQAQDCPDCRCLMVKQGADADTGSGFIDPDEFNRFRCYTCEPAPESDESAGLDGLTAWVKSLPD